MISILLAQFGLSFLYVMLKAWQQLNVVHDNFWWIFPTSVGMATAEVYTVHNILASGGSFSYIAAMGIGASFGSCVAMVLHKKMRRHGAMATEEIPPA